MIRYACPKCDTSLKSSDDSAGTKTACPRCGERFDVPAAAPEKEKSGGRKERNGDSRTTPIRKPISAGKKGPGKGAAREESGSKTPVVAFIGIGVGALAIVAVVGVLLLTKKSDKGTQVAVNPATNAPPPPVATQTAQTAQTAQAQTTPVAAPPPPKAGTTGHRIYNGLLKSTVFIHGEAVVGKHVMIWEGSGSLIDRKNKLILTNWHVVQDAVKGGATSQLFVMFPEYDEEGQLITRKDRYERKGMQGKWAIMGHAVTTVEHSVRDLALIRLDRDPPARAEVMKVAHGSASEGDTVYSLGNPGASDACWVFTQGNVRQVYHPPAYPVGGGLPEDVFVIDANILETSSPTNPGDSGGPMVNDKGELVAVTHAGNMGANLMSLFIDVSEVKTLLTTYYTANKMKPGWDVIPGKDMPTDLLGLTKALDGNDIEIKRYAAGKIGDFGLQAQKVLPTLVKHLTDPDEYTRARIAQSLEQIGGLTAADLAAVMQALKDPSVAVRKACVGAIGKMGPEGGPAAKPLGELLSDPELEIRRVAALALGEIGVPAKEAVPALAKALKDKDTEVRMQAAKALAKMRSESVAAMKEIGDSLGREPNIEVKMAVLAILEPLGPDAKEAVPALIQAITNDRNSEIRRRSVALLRTMGAGAKAAAPTLVTLLGAPELGTFAEEALVAIGTDAVTPLREALKDKQWKVRAAACKALGDIGPDAKSAQADLERLWKTETKKEVKKAAEAAFNKVKGK
jgi:HEAT repeat protein/S1-C subfamily serine protease